eukprot:1660762-Rhodomonas_salina.1
MAFLRSISISRFFFSDPAPTRPHTLTISPSRVCESSRIMHRRPQFACPLRTRSLSAAHPRAPRPHTSTTAHLRPSRCRTCTLSRRYVFGPDCAHRAVAAAESTLYVGVSRRTISHVTSHVTVGSCAQDGTLAGYVGPGIAEEAVIPASSGIEGMPPTM